MDITADELWSQRPSWRGWLHAATFVAALPAGIWLILHAHGASARSAAAIYAATVVLLFGTSAAYHRLGRSLPVRRVLRRCDHATIFLLIAGTYTPVCLLALPLAWGIPVLAVVVAGCTAGFVLKLAAFDRLRWVGYALYPVLGWTAVVVMPAMAAHLTRPELALIVAGGIVYSAGFPVLLTHRPNPWPRRFGYHEVWHACTVAAGVCHFAAIGLIVR